MRYYLIAGEASGDIHGANLMRALSALDPNSIFRCWGGDRMLEAGGALVRHYRDTAYMGFWDVITHLRSILKNIALCKKDIAEFQPHMVVFIDYPGFNIRIAKWLHRQRVGGKLVYYISPQVWAWKSNRAVVLKEVLDAMFVILPFEVDFYKKYQFGVTYVGHPLLDHLSNQHYDITIREKYNLDQRAIIALLPGSRRQEISKILPVMMELVSLFAGYQFVIGAVSTVPGDTYQIRSSSDVTQVVDDTNLLLKSAAAALVASGTATLETALMKVPQVVCYRGNRFNYLIAKRLIHVRYISLVNLILDQPLVVELIQDDFTKENLSAALSEILTGEGRSRQLEGYDRLTTELGKGGASKKVAQEIVRLLGLEAGTN